MKKTLLLTSTLLFFTAIHFVSAQRPPTPPTGSDSNNPPPASNGGKLIEFKNPFKVGDDLYDVVSAIVNNIVLPVGGVLAVLAFIYSGFLYVTAQGNETKIKSANQALLNTAIGTALLLGAWVFANVIRGTIEQLVT